MVQLYIKIVKKKMTYFIPLVQAYNWHLIKRLNNIPVN